MYKNKDRYLLLLIQGGLIQNSYHSLIGLTRISQLITWSTRHHEFSKGLVMTTEILQADSLTG